MKTPHTIKIFLYIFLFLTISIVAKGQQGHIPGELIVQLYPEKSIEQVQKYMLSKSGVSSLKVKRQLSAAMNIYLMSFDTTGVAENKQLEVIRSLPGVKAAQFNHKVELRSTLPDDVMIGQQWALNNTGQTGGTPGADINAAEAWDLSTGGLSLNGDTIVVAVIDGSFEIAHEDITFWKNHNEIPNNNIDDDNNGYIDDYDGWNAYDSNGDLSLVFSNHGTHVSGIIGAIGNNNKGISGVNWNIQVMPIAGSSGNEAIVIEAYSYAYDMRLKYNQTNGAEGAFIVATNSSFGVNFGDPANYPVWCGFYDTLGSVGILSATATANLNINVDDQGDIPTTCPGDYMIAVTNSDHNDLLNSSAAYGKEHIDLSAPGTNILSAGLNNGYAMETGTSMATPYVAGAIGFLYSVAPQELIDLSKSNPSAIALILKNYILNGTDPLPGLEDITVTGGRLNLYKSALKTQNYTCELILSSELNDCSCYNLDDGSIILTPETGIPPYSYSWSNGDSTKSIQNISAGSYQVIVEDDANCSDTSVFEIRQPDSLSVKFATSPSYEDNPVSGKAWVNSAGGGTPPYNYIWPSPAEYRNDTVINLSGGTYNVEVNDANNCSKYITVAVEERSSRISDIRFEINPADNKLEVNFLTPSPVDVHFLIYNASGAVIHSFSEKQAGSKTYTVNSASWRSGVYFVKATFPSFSRVKKAVVF